MQSYDVAIIGAGAAGMMAAAVAGQRGRRVVLIDHAEKLAEKIRISGGGRCNFTNVQAAPQHFLSDNPHFCKSALQAYRASDFLAMVQRHNIAFHEKHKGQLFCNDSSEQIIRMLQTECETGKVHWQRPCKVMTVKKHARAVFGYEAAFSKHDDEKFYLQTNQGELCAEKLIIATGGLSIPQIGASDWGYRLATQFGHTLVAPQAALVPLTFAPENWHAFADLAGIALEVECWIHETPFSNRPNHAKQKGYFLEDCLFTHRGLSGPAILQVSSYWQLGDALCLNLIPAINVAERLIAEKNSNKKTLSNTLSAWLPQRLADTFLHLQGIEGTRKAADVPNKTLQALGQTLNAWVLQPNGSEGYRKAEVTRGGVNTRELAQHSMESKIVKGLYFVGEVMDVTGWLGGYNFQWAWASGYAAGNAV